MTTTASRARVLALGALWCAYPLLPPGTGRDVAYDVFAVLCIVIGLVAARRLPSPVRRGWLLVLLGFGGWVLGDVVFSLEQHVVHLGTYPAPSDAVYLAAYAVIAAGLLHLVRGRQNRSDPTPLLDAAIVAVGFGIVVGTFLVAPIAADSSLSVAGRLAASGYPVADVLLMGVLVRLWTTVGARTPALRWLMLSILATLAADLVWSVIALRDPSEVTAGWLDMLWLLGYLGAAAAASATSAAQLGTEAVQRESTTSPRRRMLALGAGLVLPGLTLLVDGALDGETAWRVAAIGSVVLSVLVLVRLGLLLHTVEVQAVQLAALARSDGLTGAPNRRTWDHELGRAFHSAEETAGPLSVALLDLDHFKRYNDEFGHQAGDLLLREAVAAWSGLLRPGEVLARYGGEEFGLILPGSDVDEAVRRIGVMQELTPRGQSFSGGIAAWAPGSEPATIVELADRALYDAKHSGRACVRIAHRSHPAPAVPAIQIALQPIVDLRSGTHVGQEALSRFADGDPEAVFAQAHRAGYGTRLEAAAVRAALLRRPVQGYLSVNVSVEALVSEHLAAVLPDDLHGIVVEITEQTDTDGWRQVEDVVRDLRTRGAAIAIDDWGRGYSNVERMMRLRPEIVKLDRSLLSDLEVEAHRDALRAIVEWARSMGAQVCAEGVECADQWTTLRDLGVRFGQGYHFGRPTLGPPSSGPSAAPVRETARTAR